MDYAFSRLRRLSWGRVSTRRHTAITGISHLADTVGGMERRHQGGERMGLNGKLATAARGVK